MQNYFKWNYVGLFPATNTRHQSYDDEHDVMLKQLDQATRFIGHRGGQKGSDVTVAKVNRKTSVVPKL